MKTLIEASHLSLNYGRKAALQDLTFTIPAGRVVAMILDGVLKEGDPLPSVRNVAAEYRVNPLTVLKGYQQLVEEGLVESRRGMGMYVRDGARIRLLHTEREQFLQEEWPRLREKLRRLGLRPQDLNWEDA